MSIAYCFSAVIYWTVIHEGMGWLEWILSGLMVAVMNKDHGTGIKWLEKKIRIPRGRPYVDKVSEERWKTEGPP